MNWCHVNRRDESQKRVKVIHLSQVIGDVDNFRHCSNSFFQSGLPHNDTSAPHSQPVVLRQHAPWNQITYIIIPCRALDQRKNIRRAMLVLSLVPCLVQQLYWLNTAVDCKLNNSQLFCKLVLIEDKHQIRRWQRNLRFNLQLDNLILRLIFFLLLLEESTSDGLSKLLEPFVLRYLIDELLKSLNQSRIEIFVLSFDPVTQDVAHPQPYGKGLVFVLVANMIRNSKSLNQLHEKNLWGGEWAKCGDECLHVVEIWSNKNKRM